MDFVNEAFRQNAHWGTGRVTFPRVSGRLVERPLLATLRTAFRRKFITVLRGLRRTGKSVLARQLLAEVCRRGSPKQGAWFEFDRAMGAAADDLDALIRFFEAEGARAVFLDEVAFVPKWQDVLKRHYDRTDLKFVVTGSSALELDRRTSESLAGRFETLRVEPFTFSEVLALKGRPAKPSRFEEARAGEVFSLECEAYLSGGGLPEIAAERDERMREGYVVESLLSPLLYKDLPAVFPSANPDLLLRTLEMLSGTVSSTYQLQALAEATGVSHPTAGTNVELLERALLVRTVLNLTASLAKQRRTAKKAVFADNGVLRALNPQVDLGKLAENAAFNVLSAKHFWRDAEGREVDVVLPEPRLAVEVKYATATTTADERNLRYFLERRKGWRGILLTKSEAEKGDIPRLPLWRVLLGGREALAGR